jgi:hypothetical protein
MVDPFVIEADQQSDTTTLAPQSLSVCLQALLTVMASKAAIESQKRQVEPFDFVNPI